MGATVEAPKFFPRSAATKNLQLLAEAFGQHACRNSTSSHCLQQDSRHGVNRYTTDLGHYNCRDLEKFLQFGHSTPHLSLM